MEKSFSERAAEARTAVSAISPGEAWQRRANNPEVVFIDPRNAEDINRTTGLIPGALNVPLSDLNEQAIDHLPRTSAIITACQGGPMGAIAAYTLQKRGYKNVCFMDGGTQAWLDAGYDTVRNRY